MVIRKTLIEDKSSICDLSTNIFCCEVINKDEGNCLKLITPISSSISSSKSSIERIFKLGKIKPVKGINSSSEVFY